MSEELVVGGVDVSTDTIDVVELKKSGASNFHVSFKPTSGKDFDELWSELSKVGNNKVRRYDPGKVDVLQNMYFKNGSIPSITVGSIVSGKITGTNGRDLVVDFGYKDSAYVNIKPTDYDEDTIVSIGDDIEFIVTEIKDKPYEIKGSISELVKINADNKLKEFYKDDIAFEAFVRDMTPAGFIIDIDFGAIQVQSFMPNSLAGVNRLTPKQSSDLVGTTVTVMMESVQKEKGVYVVSRRKYLNSIKKEREKELVRGQSYVGTVTGKIDFGVFVEFNECLTGMIHESNLSEETKKSEIKDGMEIEFYLRDMYRVGDGQKLILSQVQRPSLWDSIKIGQSLTSKVISVKEFGVLVSLDEDTTGLIQNSNIKKQSRQFKKGDEIDVIVLNVVKDSRKIYLDIKA